MDKRELDALDANWGDEDEDEDDDLDALEGGWQSPHRHRTAAERAVARKEKAFERKSRANARAVVVAEKQKKKQPKRKSVTPPEPSAKKRARKSAPVALDVADEAPEKKVGNRSVRAAKKRDWVRMLVAVGVIVAIASLVLYLMKR